MAATIEEAVKALSQKFLMQEGIAGVGCASEIVVYLESPEHLHKVPETILGCSVKAKVIGKLRVLVAEPSAPAALGSALSGQVIDRRARVRPVPGGVSAGHPLVGAGTVGCVVYDARTGRRLFLSNNHVFAASGQGRLGDPILQPGRADGGSEPIDVVGRLERYVELLPPPDLNLVDAAVALPVSEALVSDEILDVGYVESAGEASVGMRVAKSGRTTGYTEGEVIDVRATVKIHGYPWGFSIFEDQILATYMAEPGDSGSLVVDAGTKAAVGLLFAGSDKVTVANKLSHVSRLLGVSISPTAPAPAPAPTPARVGLPLGASVALGALEALLGSAAVLALA